MRNWKDNGQNIPIKNKRLIYLALCGSLALSISHYWLYGFLSIENIIGIGLVGFCIWGMRFGGLYKIARYIAERKARQSDNDWSQTWKK